MSNQPDSLRDQLNQLMRHERAQLLAILIQKVNDIELAEDALQEAFVKAWSHWPDATIPDNPKSWLLKTAYHHAIDGLRRQSNFHRKQPLISQLQELQQELSAAHTDHDIADERLRLIFSCCHPALDEATQVALTLNTVCGFTAEQVAASFMLKTATLAQRLVRAKRKIKLSGIPYQVPDSAQLPARLDQVLSVIYLIYNAGYYAHEQLGLINPVHTDEAMYLANTLNQLLPDQAEVLGLLSLMHFHQSRMPARHAHPDRFISLEHQDRRMWDQDLIAAANTRFQQAMALKNLGPYQIQAAISGVHSLAKSWSDTDWPQIVALYEKLWQYQPTDPVRINHAVALSYAGKVEAAWHLLQTIDTQQLPDYLPYFLAHAQIAKLRAQPDQAISYLSQAMALSKNQQERAYIQQQMDRLH
jgi:RNA polymerase sigma-70 factor (ECF subfamily)